MKKRIRHKQQTSLSSKFVKKKLNEYFNEDNIQKDITTNTTQDRTKKARGVFVAKEDLVFVGKEVIVQGFHECCIHQIKGDGSTIKRGDHIATISGPIKVILNKERVILNLIQRLSGIASETKKISERLIKQNIQLLDTRKTTPGLRAFEKFAVFIGGGTNHRFSLQDAIMIKDNHLIGNSNIKGIIKKAKKDNPGQDVQIEIETTEQLKKALQTRVDSILLDNFSPKKISNAIKTIRESKRGNSIYIEISGGINANNIDKFCINGVDGISMGALTHNNKSKDISLDVQEKN